MADRPNIALIVLDTLRKDAFDDHFGWLSGKRFEWAWSPGHCTPPSHAALFTGRYPREVGVHLEKDMLQTDYPVLAELLSRAGYTTRAHSANPLISPLFNFDRGFDEFDIAWSVSGAVEDLFDWDSFLADATGLSRYPQAILECIRTDAPTLPSLTQGVRLKLSDLGIGPYSDDGAKAFHRRIRSSQPDSPEFLFVNLMEAHSPYRPPREYRTLPEHYYPDAVEVTFNEETRANINRDHVTQAYTDSVRYLSEQYEKIHAELCEQFDLVITCADHGELFGSSDSDGFWGHFHGVYPGLTHVPIVISGDSVSDEQIHDPVSLLDVFTTILQAAGVDGSRGRGQDLLDTLDQQNILTETHGISEMQLSALEAASGLETRDQALECNREFGGIVSEDYYGFETPTGFREIGDHDSHDGKTNLECLREQITNADSQRREVSGQVAEKLEQLGYK